MSAPQAVQPVTAQAPPTTTAPANPGIPGGNVAAPANVPNGRRTFRKATAPITSASSAIMQQYVKGSGSSSLLEDMDNYNVSVNNNNTVSYFLPSFIALKGAIYLATSRLANHDRFLKDTGLFHPILDEAYIGFLFLYHIIRCNRHILQWNPGFSSFLSELEAKYPPHQLHVPGYAVAFFMSITTVQSPYFWQSHVAPSLPSLTNVNGGGLFLLPENRSVFVPHILAALDQLHVLAGTPRANMQVRIFEPYRDGTSLFGTNINNGNITRWIATTPNYKLASSSSPRTDFQFFTNVAIDPAIAAPADDNFNLSKLDIPRRYNLDVQHNTEITLPEFLGIQEYSHIDNRRTRWLNWPLEYSAVMAYQCQYVHGSRTLNDIPTTGLGACLLISDYVNFPGTDPTTDPATPALRAANRMTSLLASVHSYDPDEDQIATQHQAVCQTNISVPAAINIPAAALRVGPIWQQTRVSSGPQFDASTYMATKLQAMISSTPWK